MGAQFTSIESSEFSIVACFEPLAGMDVITRIYLSSFSFVADVFIGIGVVYGSAMEMGQTHTMAVNIQIWSLIPIGIQII